MCQDLNLALNKRSNHTYCLVPAGNRFSKGEHKIPLNTQASLVWPGGQRAYMECAFDRAPVQYLEVSHAR